MSLHTTFGQKVAKLRGSMKGVFFNEIQMKKKTPKDMKYTECFIKMDSLSYS